MWNRQDLARSKLTSHSTFRSLRRSAYFRDRGAAALELVMIVPEADLGTEAEADVLIERAILETGAVRRGPTMLLRDIKQRSCDF